MQNGPCVCIRARVRHARANASARARVHIRAKEKADREEAERRHAAELAERDAEAACVKVAEVTWGAPALFR